MRINQSICLSPEHRLPTGGLGTGGPVCCGQGSRVGSGLPRLSFRPSSLSRRLFAAFWFQVGSPSLWLFSGVHLLQMEGKELPQWEPPPSPAATPFKTVEEKASGQKICSPKASLS